MDPRDRENFATKWYKSFNQERMVFVLLITNEKDEEEEIEIPAVWEVCGLCDGRGTHTNPGIDSNGLTAEDFAEDPDFRESYMSGAYDVNCYRCDGRTTAPVVDHNRLDKKQKDAYEEAVEDCNSYDYEREAERRMGC